MIHQTVVDHIIVGSGIAGLSAAHALADHGTILVITKGAIHAGSTEWAQGGIAVAMNPDDTAELHFADTMAAGDGLCNPDAVRILVDEGPQRVADLVRLGANFDHHLGHYSFTREAAHSRRRILHAGDATGKEIEKTLGNTIRRIPNITFMENTVVTRLLMVDGNCVGCEVMFGTTRRHIIAKSVILATGGCGQLYSYNTNPPVATGDGIGLAFDVGARVQDMEFTQFHPTTLYTGDKRPISLFLITEAVRGEGGKLRNKHGDRFMERYHPDAELAPRDVVARAVFDEMQRTQSAHVFLDLGDIPMDVESRFPTIFQRCRKSGIDLRRDFIPVAPAAHYFMGGVTTTVHGQTTINRLYAAGEVASLGIHGANRLASNSLLDGLVFGWRAGKMAANDVGVSRQRTSIPDINHPPNDTDYRLLRSQLRDHMWNNVGLVRDRRRLESAMTFFEANHPTNSLSNGSDSLIELRHMLTVGRLMTQFAMARESSWGSHYRSDFPEKKPSDCGHFTLTKDWDQPRFESLDYATVE